MILLELFATNTVAKKPDNVIGELDEHRIDKPPTKRKILLVGSHKFLVGSDDRFLFLTVEHIPLYSRGILPLLARREELDHLDNYIVQPRKPIVPLHQRRY